MSGTLYAQSPSWQDTAPLLRLSVVVPVFRTERYLVHALNSLVPSDPGAIEVIVVHDGGDDGSLALADAWVRAAPVAACLIDQVNAGLSCARMAGMAVARAPFLGFLDSDDLADSEVLLAMVGHAERTGCDVVLCRSVLFDDADLHAEPFYDERIWELILDGHHFRRLTVAQEPRLVRLEPNANPRVIRRAFADRIGFGFPPGLLFEDLPAHVSSLGSAGHVGVLDAMGYWYRIGRPGKITNERSDRRFDALRSVNVAIDNAASLGPDARANMALQAVRLLFWCAQNVTNGSRGQFVAEAVATMRRLEPWVLRRARTAWTIDERERLLVGAFAAGAEAVLCDLASARRPRIGPALRLMLHPEGRTAVKMALRMIATPAISAGRRLGRMARGVAPA